LDPPTILASKKTGENEGILSRNDDTVSNNNRPANEIKKKRKKKKGD
jgi:hypothetical protein